MKGSPLRILAEVIILAIGVIIIVFITQQAYIANRDFISYWEPPRLGVDSAFLVSSSPASLFWTAPAWVAWFVYANRPVQSHRDVPALASGS